MPNFVYIARDASGKSVSGSVVADTQAEALKMIRAENKYPVSVREAEPTAPAVVVVPRGGRRGIKIPRWAVIHIATQLSVMVETGVPLGDALECVARQADHPGMKAIVTDLLEHLQAGFSFSDSLRLHPRSFPVLLVSLMKAGEKTGMLGRMLERAVHYLRDEQDVSRRVRGALTYPVIMLTFAVVTTTFLLAFVLPRFTVIYAAKKAALPIPTQIVMDLSSFIVHHWPALLMGIASLIVGGIFYIRTEGGRRAWHGVQINMPLLGGLYRKLHLARGLRMVGTMAGAGVALMDCVNTAYDLSSNTHFRGLWGKIAEELQAGRQLSDPLFESPLVPRSVSQMIFSGEKSGKIGLVMEQIAGYAEQELKDQIAQLTRYIEPAMIILMGMIIGGVALAMLLPVFTISRVIAH